MKKTWIALLLAANFPLWAQEADPLEETMAVIGRHFNGGFKNQLQCDRLISYHISRGFLQWRNGSAIII